MTQLKQAVWKTFHKLSTGKKNKTSNPNRRTQTTTWKEQKSESTQLKIHIKEPEK